MPVVLDVNRAYAATNFNRTSLKNNSVDLLDRKISTGKMNLIQNGLSPKGMDKRLAAKDVDLSILSRIDFSKVNPKTHELANGRSLNEVVRKLVKYAKA